MNCIGSGSKSVDSDIKLPNSSFHLDTTLALLVFLPTADFMNLVVG